MFKSTSAQCTLLLFPRQSANKRGGGDVAELRDGKGSLDAERRDLAAAFEPELEDEDEPEDLGSFLRDAVRFLSSSSVSEAEENSISSSSTMLGTLGGRDIRGP